MPSVKTNKICRSYQVRYTNWETVAQFLLNLTFEEVLNCFKFHGGGSGKNRRKITDMLRKFQSEYALPFEERFAKGKKIGKPPQLGVHLDLLLYRLVSREVISLNQTRYKANLSTTPITPKILNMFFVKVIGSLTKEEKDLEEKMTGLKLDKYKFNKHLSLSFRARWDICPSFGILQEPNIARGCVLEYSAHAIEEGYCCKDWLDQSVRCPLGGCSYRTSKDHSIHVCL